MTLAFPQPPADMVMPSTEQAFFTWLVGCGCCVALVVAVRTWRRTGSPVRLLLLLGSLVAVTGEGVGDILQGLWFPSVGQWTAIEAFGRPIPIWAALAYPLYYGALSWLVLSAVERGVDRRSFWRGIVVLMGLDASLQAAFLRLDVATYYGHHPFTFFGFPPYFQFVNLLVPILAAVVIARCSAFFRGPRRWLIVPMVPALQWLSYAVGLPMSLVLGTDQTGLLPWMGAVSTMAIGLIIFNVLADIAAGTPAGAQHGTNEPRQPRSARGAR